MQVKLRLFILDEIQHFVQKVLPKTTTGFTQDYSKNALDVLITPAQICIAPSNAIEQMHDQQ